MKIPCLNNDGDSDNFGQIEPVAEDQVSLLEEAITPRNNLPPLFHKLSERKPEKLDWIGQTRYTFWHFLKLLPYTLAGFDLMTHSSGLLGGRRRRCL
jgi:hypothetical protein